MMGREEICQFINNVFATMTDVETIQESDDLVEDLGISSMDILTLVSYLEEEFHITITERMLRKVATVSDLVDLVQGILA
jgi:acyl carrier protein